MIKRTTRKYTEEILNKHQGWNILDLACGETAAWKQANTLLDIHDHSKSYPGRKFIQWDVNKKTPFKDKEFDFVISCHIAEHIINPQEFCKELTRIGKKGYIEVPTPLFDNLVSGINQPPLGHKWWVTLDDPNETIIFVKRINIIENTVEIPEYNKLRPFFKESCVTEIYWEDNVDMKYGNPIFDYEGKFYDLEKEKIEMWKIGQNFDHIYPEDIAKYYGKTLINDSGLFQSSIYK